jgi:ABC-type phosphate/phosphonate transport system substrate-binding protein
MAHEKFYGENVPMRHLTKLLCQILLVIGFTASSAYADLVLSTQPRPHDKQSNAAFEQVAAYLSKATGERVVYQASRDYLSYARDLRQNKFDIVFDEAHFVAWRLTNRNHVLVAAAVPESAEQHVVVVKRENMNLQHIAQLAGRTTCGMAPPNLATLSLLSQFDNPMRVPFLLSVESYESAYQDMIKGRCQAAVMSEAAFVKLDKDKGIGKSIFVSPKSIPGDAFTVGPGVRPELRAKLLEALLSPDTMTEMKLFSTQYAHGKLLDLPVEGEYRGLERLLKNQFGF